MTKLTTLLTALLLPLTVFAQDKTVTIEFASPVVGTKRSSKSRDLSKQTVILANKGKETNREEQVLKDLRCDLEQTVLETKEGEVTKMALLFREHIDNSDEAPETSPVKGLEFTIGIVDDELSLKSKDGKEADEAQYGAVLSKVGADFGRFGENIAELLPERELSIGETITASKKALEEILSDDVQQFTTFALKLTGTRKHRGVKCAVFELSSSATVEIDEDLQLTTTSQGEVLIGLQNGWIYKRSIKGTLAGKGKQKELGATFDIAIRGTFSEEEDLSYSVEKRD